MQIGACEEFFEHLKQQLRTKGQKIRVGVSIEGGGKRLDFVRKYVPMKRNKCCENKTIKEIDLPEKWEATPSLQ